MYMEGQSDKGQREQQKPATATSRVEGLEFRVGLCVGGSVIPLSP